MFDPDNFSSEHSAIFNQNTWLDRLRDFLSFVPAQASLFAAVTISFWGVAEVFSEIGNETLSLKNLAAPAIATGLVIALYRAGQAYIRYVPEALRSENLASQNIFRRRNLGWQYALAREILLRRVSSVSRRLQRVHSGAQFISPQHLTGPEYLDWIKRRPDCIHNLLEAVALQCTDEVPAILARTRDEAGLEELKESIIQLAFLYEEAAKFEEEVRTIVPPSQLLELHKLTHGWLDPVRKGVEDFADILRQMGQLKPREIAANGGATQTFKLVFDASPRMGEFSKSLKNLNNSVFE